MASLFPPVYAVTLPTESLGPASGVASIQSLETLFINIVNAVIALAGVALFLMFIIGGFTFLFAGGDQKRMEQARGTLTNAIIGLVVVVAAYLIIRVISAFTGVQDILRFTIPGP